ncbi:hypothetical protein [uncultured Desulfovibrio sp.]|uniref:hypothetical protein n=1 Tax=uncultured Desulfovibrio sp. TaxID=167968 RepID=UPI0025FE571C|nr:hypothetical protein [uncultured Desulfovibrio sp.]
MTLASADEWRVECPRCGGPFLVNDFLAELMSRGFTHRDSQPNFSSRQRSIASTLLRQQKVLFMLDGRNKDYFINTRDLSMLEKSDKLLLLLEKQSSNGNGFQQYVSIDFENLSLQADCWAMNTKEVKAIFSILKERELLTENPTQTLGAHLSAAITAKGWERLEQLHTPNKDSAQGFVAMWFAPEMTNIYENVLALAIQSAGYMPHRVDQREHIDKIDDEIILQIRRSRFVVADATGHRGGVYYEAGFASGLGLPVFWTCRKDAMKDLHFDVNHYNCIVWEPDKLDEFRNALARRIEAVLGRGPRPTT